MAGMRKFKCYECRHIWEGAYGSGRPGECPKCQSKKIHIVEEERGYVRDKGFVCGKRRCGRV